VETISGSKRFKTVYSELNKLNYSKQYKQYSNAETAKIFSSLSDVIPDDGYTGFYVNQLKRIGKERFVELANKARAGSDTPAILFCWMLKNDGLVR
jgi:fatty acid/phospholipid biosynthesis enzyme